MPRPLPTTYSYWVTGRLLAGFYPGARDPGDAAPGAVARKLRAYLDAGVDFFIDLTSLGEMEPYEPALLEVARQAGVVVTYRRLPVRDFTTPARDEMVSILDTIDQAIAASRTVYVHCWGGVGRTGTVVGCWLARHGLTGDAALARVQELFGPSAMCYPQHRRSPETTSQREFVRGWSEGGGQT